MDRTIFIKILADKIFTILIVAIALISMVPLFVIMISMIKNGVSSLSINLFTQLPAPPPQTGGILNAIVGSGMLIMIASIISIPIGILAGLFMAEFDNTLTRFLRIAINILQGLPSIVVGILAYTWIVRPMGNFSCLSGGVALSIIMLPIVIKNTEETIKLIPHSLKEAAYSLGASYTKTTLKVTLPAATSGILTGILISIARIAGETAPLLFTAFGNPFFVLNPLKPVDSLPLVIFNYAMSPYEEWHRIAWASSLVLITIVLLINIAAKVGTRRWKTQF